jgi:hypothetical protein
MIARPKISRNEWKTAEIGAFEVGNFAPFSCPARNASAETWYSAKGEFSSAAASGLRGCQ